MTYPRRRDWLATFAVVAGFILLALWGFLDISRRLIEAVWG